MKSVCAIVLAAGEGTRMKSNNPKVLSTVLFKPMLQWVIDALKKAEIEKICVVTGFKSEAVRSYLFETDNSIETVVQEKRLGTAHAVITAKDFLEKNIESDVIILGGDSPFIDAETIKNSYQLHIKSKNSATIISSNVENPFGYGRIVRDPSSKKLLKIVEQKDASEKIQSIKEVNSGAYWFNVKMLLPILGKIKNNNAQNEYYLPDAIKFMLEENLLVDSYTADSSKVVLGANDCLQLNTLNEIARKSVLEKLMLQGVDIPCTDGVIISNDVTFGFGTRVLPGTIINGVTKVGSNCVIGPNSFIADCVIHDNVILNSVHCCKCTISDTANLKPFTSIFNKKA